jgi:hypothetical protein
MKKVAVKKVKVVLAKNLIMEFKPDYFAHNLFLLD